MKLRSLKKLGFWVQQKLENHPDQFLSNVSGVVHVGANTGQERAVYDRCDLDVLWIEPIPHVFAQLQENIKPYARQSALKALITDRDDDELQFHVANNDGASSSILDLKEHKDVWPEVNYTETLLLKTVSLMTLFKREKIDASKYQALIIDTQGSELLVLLGGVPLLKGFKFIKTEVPDFESYAGCCQLSDMQAFMQQHGFVEHSRNQFAQRAQGGSYFDVIYRRA